MVTRFSQTMQTPARQATGSALRQESGPNGLPVASRTFLASRSGGIPPQYAEAMRQGTHQKSLKAWVRMGSPRSARAARRAKRGGIPLLEPKPSNPTEPTPDSAVLKICSAGCGRIVCPGCRVKSGLKRRADMIATLKKARQTNMKNGVLWMWTLTIDPKKYDSPAEAHGDITTNERIRKLAKKMGWEYWCWVLEWHKSGWPHWHVLVWARNSLRHEHSEVARAWGHHVLYTRSSDRKWAGLNATEKIEKATHYVTKYLTKPGESQTPDWVLDSTKRIRMYGASTAWRQTLATVSDEERDAARSPLVGDGGPEERKTHRAAISECGTQAVLLRAFITAHGEMRHEFVGKINLPFRSVKAAANRLSLVTPENGRGRSIRAMDGTESAHRLRQFLDPFML